MPRFLINRLVVLCPQKQKGRAIDFHPKATILVGPNGTGKSSLLKSLLRTFGTVPQMMKPWEEDATHALVEFTVDGRVFQILREGETFTSFANGRILGVFRSVTKGLGPWLAELLEFKIKLTDKSGKLITPPPAFLFLPFYFDQDTSWNKSWNGFRQLQQIRNWQRDLIEYHIGLKPNEYYTTKGEQLQKKEELLRAEQRVQALKGIREQIKDEYQEVTFTVDLEAFQAEIKELLVACSNLQKEAEKIKVKLVEYYTAKIELESQIEIVGASLKEISKDFSFLVKHEDRLECPTCGTRHERSFADIFGIAKDEGKLEALLRELQGELAVVLKQIEEMEGSHRGHESEIAQIKLLLERKQTEVQLKDLIDAEGKKKLKSLLQLKFDENQKGIFALVEKIEELQKQLNGYVDKSRREEIKNAFHLAMRRNLAALAVSNVPPRAQSDYFATVLNQGSDQPRTLLAYAFSILEVMHPRSSSVFCPVVIDSPIQQEQDVPNHLRIVEFIRDHMPAGEQLIMGIVDHKNVDFGGSIIEMTGSRSVLRAEDYADLYEELSPFIRASLEFTSAG